MSRTRIVKGKITKIVGEDLRYYSEADITESAADTYNEKSGKGILHAGNPAKAPAGEILGKCLVRFRPSEKYVGQYGFDWIRVGDTNLTGDTPYKDIICDKNGKAPNAEEFNLLKNRFSTITMIGKNVTYIIPELNLYPGFESQLLLYIDVEEAPEKIILKYDKKYLDLRGKNEIKNLAKTSAGKSHKEYLTVYARQASSKANYIEAYSVDKMGLSN